MGTSRSKTTTRGATTGRSSPGTTGTSVRITCSVGRTVRSIRSTHPVCRCCFCRPTRWGAILAPSPCSAVWRRCTNISAPVKRRAFGRAEVDEPHTQQCRDYVVERHAIRHRVRNDPRFPRRQTALVCELVANSGRGHDHAVEGVPHELVEAAVQPTALGVERRWRGMDPLQQSSPGHACICRPR